MPAREEVLQKHLAGPKYRRLLKIKKIMDVHGEIFEDIGYATASFLLSFYAQFSAQFFAQLY